MKKLTKGVANMMKYYTQEGVQTKGVLINGIMCIVNENKEGGETLYYASDINDMDNLVCIARDWYCKDIIVMF